MSQQSPLTFFHLNWSVPKRGNLEEQNEDAVRVEELPGKDSLLIAVADGATEAVYSRLWAQRLVAAAEPDWPTLTGPALEERLQPLRRSFSPLDPARDVPWFVRRKFVEEGSQATLLVATVAAAEDPGTLIVQAVSVGDSCLFVFKETGQVWAFPIRASQDFGTHPSLVSNRSRAPIKYAGGKISMQAGDLLLASTDAVARWTLQCLESGQTGLIWEALRELLGAVPPRPGVSSGAAEATARGAAEWKSLDGCSKEPDRPHLLPDLRGWLARALRGDVAKSGVIPAAAESDSATQVEALPVVLSPAGDRPLPFPQFIDRCRAADSKPRMRNDDATLVVCFPVSNQGPDQLLEVEEILRRLAKAIPERPVLVCPVDPVAGQLQKEGEGSGEPGASVPSRQPASGRMTVSAPEGSRG